KRLTEYYVYPDVAEKMIQAMLDHQKHGDYNSIVDGNEFADALSRDLKAVSHDQHLFVGYGPFILPDQSGSSSEPRPPSPADQARFRTMLEHQNCTFSMLEILNHNIGYVRFGAFPDPDICGPTVVAAMNFLVTPMPLSLTCAKTMAAIPAWWISWFLIYSESPLTSTISPIARITRHINIGRCPGCLAPAS